VNGTVITEIIAGVPIVAAAIVSVIAAVKASNSSKASAAALKAHTDVSHLN
jgi:hypothetical protein